MGHTLKDKTRLAVQLIHDVLERLDSDDVEGLEAIQNVLNELEEQSVGTTVKEIAWKLRLANKLMETFNLESGEMIGGSEASRSVIVGGNVITMEIEM